ncbi:hypothetical protein C8R45DRAFT_929572 [Mycena sanguinolenta]|nr:hypothetical protein C8R45DRAFT_929572 [Mycena sanguinolenta]
MSVIRTKARTKMLSAVTSRLGPFTDATNTIGGGIESAPLEILSGKPVSRRVARQRTKRHRANSVGDDSKEIDTGLAEPVLNSPTINAGALKAPLTTRASEPTSSPPVDDASPAYTYTCGPRRPPQLIIRTLPEPSPPPKKFYGPFEACSRADVLFDPEDYMPRTFEEDAWGIIYSTGPFAGSILGPVRVITLQAPAGVPGSVQFFYGLTYLDETMIESRPKPLAEASNTRKSKNISVSASVMVVPVMI